MTLVPIPLDRIFLDDLDTCPRSSMLRMGAGDRPELRASPWWVYVASARLPNGLGPGSRQSGLSRGDRGRPSDVRRRTDRGPT